MRAAPALALVWIGAFVLAAALLAPFALGNRSAARLSASAAQLVEGGPGAIFIGSSAIGAAVPPETVRGAGMPSFAWQRLLQNGADRHDMLLLAEAVAPHATRLFVEAPTLVRERFPDAIWPASVLYPLGEHMRHELRITLGQVDTRLLDLRRESEFVTGSGPPARAPLRPVVRMPPAELARWQALAAALAARGGGIILVDIPRAALDLTAADEAWRRSMREEIRRLAEALDAPIFEPAPWWDGDAYFNGTHLNAAGRARFMREFSLWAVEALP